MKIITFALILISFAALQATITHGRDPFHLPSKTSLATTPATSFKLVGTITCNEKPGAIVMHDKQQCVVHTGDSLAGYLVTNITSSTVELANDTEKKQITL